MSKIKVLVVDDSATIRMLLSKGLNLDPELEVVGTAPDPYVARNKIVELSPDVITLDVEMPRMDGIEFLRRLMAAYPLPVVMVSALTEKGKRITLEALDAGAFDFVHKPSGSHGAQGLQDMLTDLRQKIKSAARANLTTLRKSLNRVTAPIARPLAPVRPTALAETTDKVVAIGASTGGTTAIRDMISMLPADFPGTVLVQHITPGFTTMFAERLNEIGTVQVKEAQHGDRIITGRVLVAPSGHQMTVRRSGGFYYVDCVPGPPICGHIPSVEALFQSVAKQVGANALGVILTGMGGDGADGMAAMRKAGARTLGQDEASCVVFGMPKVAWEKGGVEKLLPLEEIVPNLLRLLRAG
ncbi:MAG TPA: chemotaxis response regulator protein-glutamate methylesterase [Candidatus Ozemobacteraceae bacterium]|nr:chemotaxis response regulator protein-glutamate methylesterase [Candidatus Ozemobacteraceae bacterium]